MPEVEPACDGSAPSSPAPAICGVKLSKGGWIGSFQRTPKSQISLQDDSTLICHNPRQESRNCAID
jgi:hypothetical protein